MLHCPQDVLCRILTYAGSSRGKCCKRWEKAKTLGKKCTPGRRAGCVEPEKAIKRRVKGVTVKCEGGNDRKKDTN